MLYTFYCGERMQKDLTIGILNGIYGSLLTERQREIIVQYFDFDLSLMEISQNLGISRQAVLDTIKKGSDQLKEYESKLGMLKSKSDNEKIALQALRMIEQGDIDAARDQLQMLINKNRE